MEAISAHVKVCWRLLWETRHGFLALGVTAIALAVALRPGTSEFVIRLTGLVLQLLGILTVAWGISETRALFGHPSFTQRTRSWLARFRLRRRDARASLRASDTLVFGVKDRAFVKVVPSDSTIDARVQAIEDNIKKIHERITRTQRATDSDFAKAAEDLAREQQLRQSEDAAIREKLEATGTGGVHISATGALWLFVGVSLSTLSQELEKLLR